MAGGVQGASAGAALGPWGAAAGAAIGIGTSLWGASERKKAREAEVRAQVEYYNREAARAIKEAKRQSDDVQEKGDYEVEQDRAQRAATGLFESEEAYDRTGAGQVEQRNLQETAEQVASIMERGRETAEQYRELARRAPQIAKAKQKAESTQALSSALTGGLKLAGKTDFSGWGKATTAGGGGGGVSSAGAGRGTGNQVQRMSAGY